MRERWTAWFRVRDELSSFADPGNSLRFGYFRVLPNSAEQRAASS